MSTDLAEFVGIHMGDGSLYETKNGNYILNYSANLEKDYKYMVYVRQQFAKLFKVALHQYISKKKNSLSLGIRSKKLFVLFRENLLVPVGKKEDLRIPKYIRSDTKYMSAFIRGLFDTDGCVTVQRFSKYSYTLVKICTMHKVFVEEIQEGLNNLGIASFICTKKSIRSGKECIGYDVVIRNKNVPNFFEIVGSNNPRNIMKYEEVGSQGLS